jgi:ABC-2 type transport system ATP-binding protein
MIAVETSNLTKRFDGLVAVDHLDMEVEQGEIFGLLGPNGAGKTTTIRMLMDIIKPDEGTIRLLGHVLSPSKGHPPGHEAQKRIGYLPEERGLYRNLKLMECLTYLAVLKGMDRKLIRKRAETLLEQVGLGEKGNSKVKALSKGMQQKAQLVATLVHDPELVILDEPFLGLDPISTEQVKELIWDLRERGKTVVLSTHQMNQVERMCDRILLIDEGQRVLYGPLEEIKARYAEHAVLVRCSGPLDSLAGARRIEQRERDHLIALEDNTSPQDILRQLVEQEIPVERFEVATPPLEEIFIRVVEENDA